MKCGMIGNKIVMLFSHGREILQKKLKIRLLSAKAIHITQLLSSFQTMIVYSFTSTALLGVKK
jgi:hypothetical protein